jgi:very-short-patch-repair endonuclease
MDRPDKRTNRIRGVSKTVQDTARVLRKETTPAEELLWRELRGQKLEGLKFRRQHPVGRFIVDFYASASHLVVELDGGIHHNNREQDEARSELLRSYGYKVLRFQNEQILNELPQILAAIVNAASQNDSS